jgi:hypothetical protein
MSTEGRNLETRSGDDDARLEEIKSAQIEMGNLGAAQAEALKKFSNEDAESWLNMNEESRNKLDEMLTADLVDQVQYADILKLDPFDAMAVLTRIEYNWKRRNIVDGNTSKRFGADIDDDDDILFA